MLTAKNSVEFPHWPHIPGPLCGRSGAFLLSQDPCCVNSVLYTSCVCSVWRTAPSFPCLNNLTHSNNNNNPTYYVPGTSCSKHLYGYRFSL